jgi:hypothetical protein
MKDRHLKTIGVIEGESEFVLYTLKEGGFQDTFRKFRNSGTCAYARKGLLRG